MSISSTNGSNSSRGSSSSQGTTHSTTADAGKTSVSKTATEHPAAVPSQMTPIQAKFDRSSFDTASVAAPGAASQAPGLTAPSFTTASLQPTPMAYQANLRAPTLTNQALQATPLGPASSFQTAATESAQAVADAVATPNPGLEAINATDLRPGEPHTCVATTRANLRRAGMEGLPSATGNDGNNPRGMMVQMLQSGHWSSVDIPNSTPRTITSPYGTVQAHVLTGEAYLEAAANGQIPEGSVVFQTKMGWDYGEGSRGSDVGIVRNGAVFNYQANNGMSVYGDRVREVVILHPN
ncbi:hypothetical protein BO221_03345 [Archangium sp. Cb G35]|uniref:hypothetical protein n=1 Tax=Archangium sp. Cb G35 TaxID=1920190 RepID=UPI0009372527|nr:hypothetical protein [Archangium sp. Cb G35]OJT27046.1 hypothetical protein BO221_03345 [Archangium sp. Cb G35]